MRLAGVAALACLAVATAGCGSGTSTGGEPGVAHENLTLNFGRYRSSAQMTYPTGGGRHPAVVLIPGSGPEDLDADVCGPDGGVLSHNFRDIAGYLSARGYAVLRYDKDGVVSRCKGAGATPLKQLLADAGTVLAAAKADIHVDRRHVFVYGWSEGSTVAAALVRAHPEVAGLIVQGGVVRSWPGIFAYQMEQIGVRYLRSLAPGGRVTPGVVAAAAGGDGGLVAKGIVRDVGAPASATGRAAINKHLDTNRDGVLEIDSEVVPLIARIIAVLLAPAGPLHAYAPGQALPVLGRHAAELTLPVLLLQGENDANVPPADASRLLAKLASSDKTLKLYPGLGHSLGRASSPIGDDFAPIAAAPLADIAAWLGQRRG
jgi:pimeloyl-ACP methyl ester carboxylesterase